MNLETSALANFIKTDADLAVGKSCKARPSKVTCPDSDKTVEVKNICGSSSFAKRQVSNASDFANNEHNDLIKNALSDITATENKIDIDCNIII